jgi:hypothetical protein
MGPSPHAEPPIGAPTETRQHRQRWRHIWVICAPDKRLTRFISVTDQNKPSHQPTPCSDLARDAGLSEPGDRAEMTRREQVLPGTAAGDQFTGPYGVPVPHEAPHRPTTNKITTNLGSPAIFCEPL